MNARPFLDTNILVYAFASDDWRGNQAEALVAAGGIVSVQVLNEFVNVCRHKIKLEWLKIESALQIIRDLSGAPLPLTVAVHEQAVALARDHSLAFYDALIVAAAMAAECPVVYTEDMQHGRRIGELLISNPFLA
jgi:predicted nucleic acid-binding protein